MRFHPEYVAQVLSAQFEDAKALFLTPLLRVHDAHLVMLAACGLITRTDALTLRDALESLSERDLRAAVYDGSCEDLFFHVERLLAAACGEDIAGRLHTARSRNDIDMTMYRMRLREMVAALLGASLELREVLIEMAAAHRSTLLAAQTHTQPAQPTTVAHYLLAVVEQLERDARRLRQAYAAVNRCPLGACAITGTGFAIDRRLTSDLLGFDEPTGNTYGSIAAADDLLESVAAASVLVAGIGRIVQDLLLWCTPEFGYLRLADGFVQTSSIMPQKRNPVALEHARAIASVALGQAGAVTLAVHNTPFADIVDVEDDLQPLVAMVFRDARRAVTLVAAALRAAELDARRLEQRAGEGDITLTELADELVRTHGLSFRTAHTLAARLVEARRRAPGTPPGDSLETLSRDLPGGPIRYTDAQLARLLSARHFVAVRRTPGGPAPVETARALDHARQQLRADHDWLAQTRDALAAAEARLRARRRDL